MKPAAVFLHYYFHISPILNANMAKGCRITVLSIQGVCNLKPGKKKNCTLETGNTTLEFGSGTVTYVGSSIRLELDL